MEEAEQKIDDGSAYAYKEYVTTVNPEVNAALRALVDGYDEAISPTLEMDPRKKGKRGSALNIDTVYYRTRYAVPEHLDHCAGKFPGGAALHGFHHPHLGPGERTAPAADGSFCPGQRCLGDSQSRGAGST